MNDEINANSLSSKEKLMVGVVEESELVNKNEDVIKNLISNSKASIIGAVELHNKPIFPYRYEVSIALTIIAWELVMKAYILSYHKHIKVIDEGWSKPFESCVGFLHDKIGNKFLPIKESLDLLYKYRCDIIHFYGQSIESILYSLLRPNILFFSDFLLEYFEIDLGSEVNLIILPIGFKRFVSPVDFMSQNLIEGSNCVKEFIKSIVKSAGTLESNGFKDGIICNYAMVVEKENNIKNADIIAGVTTDPTKSSLSIIKTVKIGSYTNDENAPKVKIDETSVFKTIFTMPHKDFLRKIKSLMPDFKENNASMKIIRENIKNDADCYRKRYLDANPTERSVGKGFYSQKAVAKALGLFPKTS